MSTQRFVGLFTNLIYYQHDGIEQVLDLAQANGITAIAFFPYLAQRRERGTRFPDLHIDGHQRILARPLWGQYTLQVKRFLSYQPDLGLYDNTIYQPAKQPLPSDLDADLPHKVIEAAHQRGMQVHIQIHPFLPPEIQDDDRPVSITGDKPTPPLVAHNACLNSPQAKAYGLALVEDTLKHYSQVDGLFTDWAEYGAYQLPDHFTCFCLNCAHQAEVLGLDWNQILADVKALWDWLHNLSNDDQLQRVVYLNQHPSAILELLTHYPGWLQFLQLKALTVTSFYQEVRELMKRLGMGDRKLSARGWPPPWNRSSGMDYRTLADSCDAVTPKLFTFDYSALPRWYGEVLKTWNPHLSETAILDCLIEIMGLKDDLVNRRFTNYNIPAPNEHHPAHIDAYRQRIQEVQAQVNGRATCLPFAHAYMPKSQWLEMLTMLRDINVDGIWVQMYGYLSDSKFDILREVWAE